MEKNNILEKLGKLKIIPVVVLNNVDSAKSLSEILIDEKLPCAEITFRTEKTLEIISSIKKTFPSIILGAGTVLSIEQAKQAVDAGAEFLVSPGFEKKLVKYCLKKEIPIIPGVATASEIQRALTLGLSVLKFFPATDLGGVKMIKALSAPFKNARFVPTGGITKENVLDFLVLPTVLACGGTWLVKKDLLEAGEFDKVRELVREAVQLVSTN